MMADLQQLMTASWLTLQLLVAQHWLLLNQLGLAVFGLSAAWMSMGRSPRQRRWAPVVGLVGQPFWLAFAIHARAYGLLAVSIVFTLVYLRGVLVQWRRP